MAKNSVAQLDPADNLIAPPQPGEYVAALLARGLQAEAIQVQRRQYEEGQLAARAGRTVGAHEVAARYRGYLDALEAECCV